MFYAASAIFQPYKGVEGFLIAGNFYTDDQSFSTSYMLKQFISPGQRFQVFKIEVKCFGEISDI